MSLYDLAVLPVRLRRRHVLDKETEDLALKAALAAAHLLGIAIGAFLRQLRGGADPLLQAAARIREAETKAGIAWEIVDLLRARLARIPERRRPHYTPAQRFRILEIKSLLGWSRGLAARVFGVCPNTIGNWESHTDPETGTVGSTVNPTPPVRRLADVVRATIQAMMRVGFGGEDRIAQVLSRGGWDVSARSVRRIVQERHRPDPTVPPSPKGKRTTPVIARFVHHVWMMDVTVVQTFLGAELHLAGVFDACSRVPLALQVFDKKPGAAAMARLLKAATKAFAAPRYVITDQGREFVGKVFRKTAATRGLIQRYGSTDTLFATSRLERFWRTLKDITRVRLDRPLTASDLESRLETALTHYLCFRPHQGLGGATPAEAFLGVEAECAASAPVPRALPGEGPPQAPFVIEYLDPQRNRFPFLKTA